MDRRSLFGALVAFFDGLFCRKAVAAPAVEEDKQLYTVVLNALIPGQGSPYFGFDQFGRFLHARPLSDPELIEKAGHTYGLTVLSAGFTQLQLQPTILAGTKAQLRRTMLDLFDQAFDRLQPLRDAMPDPYQDLLQQMYGRLQTEADTAVKIPLDLDGVVSQALLNKHNAVHGVPIP